LFARDELTQLLSTVGIPVVTPAVVPVIASRAVAMNVCTHRHMLKDPPLSPQGIFKLLGYKGWRDYLASFACSMTKDRLFTEFSVEDDDDFVAKHDAAYSLDVYLGRFIGFSVNIPWDSDARWLERYMAMTSNVALSAGRRDQAMAEIVDLWLEPVSDING